MSFNAISAALCSASHQSREIDAPVFCHPLTGCSSYQYPLWTQWISLSKLTNQIDFDLSAHFRCPPSACWHKDVQPRLFDPIHSAGNEFEPEVVFVSPSLPTSFHNLCFPLLMLVKVALENLAYWLLPTMMPLWWNHPTWPTSVQLRPRSCCLVLGIDLVANVDLKIRKVLQSLPKASTVYVFKKNEGLPTFKHPKVWHPTRCLP